MKMQNMRRQPTPITHIARGGAAVIGVMLVILTLAFPPSATSEELSEYALTVLFGVVVGGAMLWYGERQKL